MDSIVSKVREEIEAFANYLPHIADEDSAVFDKQFHNQLNHIDTMFLDCPRHRLDLMEFLFEICGKELDKSTMFHHSRHKPFGYPGDYLILDWIYTNKTDSTGRGRLWDEFYQRQAAPQAVRNRKDFFCDTFTMLCDEAQRGLSVLNLACGPCRDIADAIILAGRKAVGSHFHCVDIDYRAIAYAKNIVQKQNLNVSFQWEVADVFKVRPHFRYDLIWAAGLFDYLDDRLAAALLKRMWRWAGDSGKIFVGNFHPGNPSRNFMEWCGKWFLKYRTPEELLMLCEQAGIPQECVTFDQDPLGVCVFLIITPKK